VRHRSSREWQQCGASARLALHFFSKFLLLPSQECIGQPACSFLPSFSSRPVRKVPDKGPSLPSPSLLSHVLTSPYPPPTILHLQEERRECLLKNLMVRLWSEKWAADRHEEWRYGAISHVYIKKGREAQKYRNKVR
jgi:hypothetical protein